MNRSLAKVCAAYHLYIVAFDDAAYEYLVKASLPNVTPISLNEFEDKELLRIKPSRSAAEYCWTSTSSIILYCLEKYGLPSCTYIDADMIFYKDPEILIDEAKGKSVIITKHRYSKEYDVSATHGIYCVQFMYFKNDEEGLRVLNWWRERCIEWCYDRQEDGKFGDQKYLDDWTTRFTGVHVLEHRGGGLAPWNVQQYDLINQNNSISLIDKLTKKKYPLVFFHFHGLKFYVDEMVSCVGALYDIDRNVKELIYHPYIKELILIENDLRKSGITYNVSGARQAAPKKSRVFVDYM